MNTLHIVFLNKFNHLKKIKEKKGKIYNNDIFNNNNYKKNTFSFSLNFCHFFQLFEYNFFFLLFFLNSV